MLLQLCERAREALLSLLFQKAIEAQRLALFAPRESKRSKEDFLNIQELEHDSLMNRVQLIIDYYLLLLQFIESLLRFIKHEIAYSCKLLLSSDCLHCLKTSTNLFDSTTHPNIFVGSTSVTQQLYNIVSTILKIKEI